MQTGHGQVYVKMWVDLGTEQEPCLLQTLPTPRTPGAYWVHWPDSVNCLTTVPLPPQAAPHAVRGSNSGGAGGTGGAGGKGKRSGVVGGGGSTVNTERQKQRDLRNKEMCDTLRQVKQYLNNTKDAGLTVNCQRTQKTINQIMMALTGGSPAPAPSQDSGVNTQPIPVTDKLF